MKNLLYAVALFITSIALGQVPSPKAAPDFVITEWHNTRPLTISQLKGKVVLLDFWGVWCSPCVKAIPKLDELAEDLKNEAFQIITIHTARKSENLKTDLPKNNYKHVVGVDKKHEDDSNGIYGHTIKAYEVQAFPTYVLIDKKGDIRFFGDFPDKSEIKKLLSEK